MAVSRARAYVCIYTYIYIKAPRRSGKRGEEDEKGDEKKEEEEERMRGG